MTFADVNTNVLIAFALMMLVFLLAFFVFGKTGKKLR